MQKQSPRVRRPRMAQAETVPWDAPTTATPLEDVRAVMSLQPLLRIATLAHQIAERYVSGKHGLAIENAANEVLHLWDELPAEIRELL